MNVHVIIALSLAQRLCFHSTKIISTLVGLIELLSFWSELPAAKRRKVAKPLAVQTERTAGAIKMVSFCLLPNEQLDFLFEFSTGAKARFQLDLGSSLRDNKKHGGL